MSVLLLIEDFDTPKDLLSTLQSYKGYNIVLSTRKVLKKNGITEDKARDRAKEYFLGGEADIAIDIVLDEKHLFINQLKEKKQ